jgi:flavin reductase (DIM6/NTAB) family NADH-FMN oxidoreductase RutF
MQDVPSTMAGDVVAAVLHLYDPPLWLVTAAHGGHRGGLIATSVVRASIVTELPRMLVAIARHHHTWGLIEASGRFALHLLPESGLDAVWRFGLHSGHRQDKFAELPAQTTPDGNPLYPGCVAWLDCRVEDSMDIGDRSVFAAQVTDGGLTGGGPVLSVAALLRDAPDERRADLDRLYAADQARDCAAILAWRQSKGLT